MEQQHIITNSILCGDAFQLIQDIPDNSIDLIITSPPYWKQRDYGSSLGLEDEAWYYVVRLAELIYACRRVIKDTGSIVVNVGDKYDKGSLSLIPYRFAIRMLDYYHSQLKLVNTINWIKTNPTPIQNKKTSGQ